MSSVKTESGLISWGSQSGVSMVRDLWWKQFTKKVSFEFRVKEWRSDGWRKWKRDRHGEVKLVHEVKQEVCPRDKARYTEQVILQCILGQLTTFTFSSCGFVHCKGPEIEWGGFEFPVLPWLCHYIWLIPVIHTLCGVMIPSSQRPTQLSWSVDSVEWPMSMARGSRWSLRKLNWTKNRQFSASREVLSMFRTLRLTENWRFSVESGWIYNLHIRNGISWSRLSEVRTRAIQKNAQTYVTGYITTRHSLVL